MDAKAIRDLQSSLRGQVLVPGHGEYEEARRIWNGMIDRRPAVIARCSDEDDVAEAVRLARRHDLLVAVKGGGHNVAGNAVCDGGIMIDLSPMSSASVDERERIARVDGGALLADLDRATQAHALAVPAGIVSHTGVAGLTLGGGFGWISRKHGLTIDNLLSARVVLADGRRLTCSATENPDLFWGLRGGGGNFGIATSFEFRCAEVGPEVYAGLIVRPFDNAADYIRFHSQIVRSMPEEMTVWMILRQAPPLPFLPSEVHGRLVVALAFVYLGDPQRGAELVRPLRDFGPIHGETAGRQPWTAWQSGFDALNEHGARNYWKSHYLTGLPDECIEVILDHARRLPSPNCEILIPHLEGAPSRIPADATAFAYREAPFLINIHTRWTDPQDDERCIGWARGFFEATKPFADGVYVNFLSDEGEERVRAAYPAGTWERLVELKNRYDRENVFRMNQNIRPSV